MAFDIHQQVFDRDGMSGKEAEQYLDQLMEFFVPSMRALLMLLLKPLNARKRHTPALR